MISVSSRHRSRRLSLQVLCCLDAQGAGACEQAHEFITDSKEDQATIDNAHALTRDAFADVPTCDRILARHARHWDLGRLALVDRNILRLATYELRSGRAPRKVVITEAIRLAKEFSTAESPRFINGVLDAVAKELRKESAASRQAGDTDSDAEEAKEAEKAAEAAEEEAKE